MGAKFDSWLNFSKGLGGKKDANKQVTFGDFYMVPDETLACMLLGDGWQKKIATIPAGSMTKEWISLTDDADNTVNNKLKALNTKNLFKEALTWQRAFRGGLIWMVSDASSTTEYKKGSRVDIKKLLVFSASEVRVNEMYTVDSLATPGKRKVSQKVDPLKIGTVKSFKILQNSQRTTEIIVNASQCLVFKGDPVPSVPGSNFENLLQTTLVPSTEYLYWGVGALQSIYPQMSRYGAFEQGMGHIGQELVVGIYKMAGLREILQSEGGPELIQNRMAVIEKAKSMINAIFLDAEGEEDFIRNTINLGGVPDLWDRFMMTVSGVSNIPASLLFGRQATGLNNKGEQDRDNYNAFITMEQERDMEDNLRILLGHLEGKEVEFVFNKLDTPTQEDLVSMKKKQAEVDVMYVTMQALSAEEVRNSRFTGEYSFETELLAAPMDDAEGDEDLPDLEDEVVEEDTPEEEKKKKEK